MKYGSMKKKAKQVIKAKEPVTIRTKQLKNGNKSIYFDIYKDGQREYEFPKLYLIQEDTEEARLQNEKTLEKAAKIKSSMIFKILNEDYTEMGIKKGNSEKQKETVIKYVRELAERKDKDDATSMHYSLMAIGKHLEKYKSKATFKQVNKEYCRGFIEYLKKAKNEKNNEQLTEGSQSGYSRLLSVVLNAAVRDEYLTSNPMEQLKRNEMPRAITSNREYLTIEEIKKLEKTECVKDIVKRAFLFTCFCGLRFSDVAGLKWGDIQKDNDGKKIIKYRQQKTEKGEYLQISEEATKYMPDRQDKSDEDIIFKLSQNGYVNQTLAGWGKAAGINKKITFHVARHTNATLLLSLGVAIETVSKMLGHSDIKTTQIYAKVVDKSKRDAADILDKVMKEVQTQ